MNLGIAGRKAIVCASTRGLGYACAEALVKEGVDVVVNGRASDRLADAVATLKAVGCGSVTGVVADVTTADGRAALLAALPDPDILVNNNAGPDPSPFDKLDEAKWAAALAANMIAPLALVKAVLPPMIERRFGRIVSITSAMVTTPRPNMTLSSGARAGLTAALKGLSLDVAKHNVTINNLLPGPFDTDRLRTTTEGAARASGQPFESLWAARMKANPSQRFGSAAEFGAVCAFIASVHAGYITGQNLLLDGGAYPGTF